MKINFKITLSIITIIIMLLNSTYAHASIVNYIIDNYDILFKSLSVNSLEDADFYLLAEQHDVIGHKHIHSNFINAYAQEGDFLLVEGVPCGQEIEANASLQSMWISVPLTIMGWDTGWMKDVTGIDLTQVEKLGIQLFHIRYDIAWNQTHHRKKEYNKIVTKLIPLMQKTQPLFDDDFYIKVRELFPARVMAMRSSLEALSESQVASYQNKKVFLIAGIYHLQQNNSHPFFSHPNMSLDVLYDFLNNNKVVILLPKQEKTDYWNTFYQMQ